MGTPKALEGYHLIYRDKYVLFVVIRGAPSWVQGSPPHCSLSNRYESSQGKQPEADTPRPPRLGALCQPPALKHQFFKLSLGKALFSLDHGADNPSQEPKPCVRQVLTLRSLFFS